MAYNTFGATPADVTNDAAGNVIGGRTFTVWTARTGGTQVTDTLNASGAQTGGIVTSSTGGTETGRIRFQASDLYAVLFLDDGTGNRWAVLSVEAMQKVGPMLAAAQQASTDSANANTTAASAVATANAADQRSKDALTEIDRRLPAVGSFTNDERLKTWLTQVSQVEAGLAARANVVSLGDSITDGSGAGRAELRYASWMRDGLQKAHAGVIGGRGFIPAIHGVSNIPDEITFSAGVTLNRATSNIWGLGRRGVQLTSGQTATLEIFGDRVGVMYTGTAGSISVAIDGGTATIIPAATGTDLDKTGLLWTSPALTHGQHTVVVTPATTTAIILDGMVEWDRDYDRGITFWDGSHNGTRLDHFDGLAANTGRWADALASVQPHLVTIAFGTNDSRQADQTTYNASTFATRLTRLVNLIRTKTTTSPSILIIIQPQPGSGSTDWTGYMASMRKVADDMGLATVDLSRRVPTGPVSGTSALYIDNLHPNAAGHLLYADTILDSLAGVRTHGPQSGAKQAERVTSFNTTSTTAVRISPRVAARVKVGPSGRVRVALSTRLRTTTAVAGAIAWMRFEMTGANTVASSASGGIWLENTIVVNQQHAEEIVSGLTPGETWVDAMIGVNGAVTGQFDDVRLIVEPL